MSNHGFKERRHRQSKAEYGNPLYSWISVAVFGVMVVGLVASFWASHRGQRVAEEDMRKWKSWPSTQGRPIATRVVEKVEIHQHGVVPVFRWYFGECQLEYSVAGKEYSVWGDADEDSDRMALLRRMRVCPFSYDVHYDPKQPWVAHAFIANHP